MGRHTRGTYAAIAALTAITVMGAGVPAEAAAPAQTVRVSKLTLSQHPAGVAWIDGRVLHTPNGHTKVLPWGKRGAVQRHLRVLRHTPRGWLVRDFTGDTHNVWVVKGGHRTKLGSYGVSEGETITIVPSLDHLRYAVTDHADGDDTALVQIFDDRGRRVVSRDIPGDGAVLDFSGPEAVVSTTDTQRWSIDDDSLTDLGVDAAGASLAHDLLLVRDAVTGEVGPTSMSAPGTPAWTAPMDRPRISPGGGRVVSRPEARSQFLEVRGIADGTVLRTFQVRFLAADAPVWADNHAFVFIGATTGLGDHERLARCTVSGHCRAQSVVRPQDRLSIPPL